MTSLFDPIKLGHVELSNRIAMAPLTRNRSPGAVPNDLNVTYYEQRASAGLLISEGTPISQQGQGYAQVPGLYLPESIEGWKRVTAAVHGAGGRIAAQLWHVGRISHNSLQPNGDQPVAPSAIRAKSKTFIINDDGTGGFVDTSEPRALALDEIPSILEDYRRAARAAIDAGFDAVEIHGANGYLIDQFLRSSSNSRSDAYGGSIENRTRFAIEAVDTIVKEIGAERTGIRISPVTPANDVSDPDPQPLFNLLVEKLAVYDLAFIHVIEGATGGDRDNLPFDWAAMKAAYRAKGGKAVWMVNNGYDRATAMDAVASGRADMVSFGRLFIANPDLVARLKADAPLNAPNRATFYGGGAEGYTDYPKLA
ncbi:MULTISPECIES: alkene reductase [Alphaproteobacteria]|uniref:Alkene reductase n=2 Tax=Alphaproteobacteria TaxID=28211 RepID=A0A512HEK6_9HYPH|nr:MULTISPECIES: alkene reductase [Alphaproteobacteria]GEO83893.1 alkene reductase [Ciceribacter naphthalenivorans]GLR21229.1 alkene reductase [Ciceribacter naphthalenivorans]GLT04085.1 alkene reductase [Sphingomonas psychrolutea]